MLKSKKNRRQDNAINAGSMADIAFLLLIFFLVTATILEDEGIKVKLPPWDPFAISEPVPDRNVLNVKVNKQNELLVEGEMGDLKSLRLKTKEFIMNPFQRDDLPQKPTKAVVSLQNDKGTSYETYLMVYNELQGAYNELWDEAAEKLFRKKYKELTKAQKKSIREEIPLVISEAEPTAFIDLN